MNKLLRKQAVRAMNCLFLILSCGNCLAQETFPEIKVSYTNELQEGILKKKDWILSPGMVPFGNGNYTDSLVNHLDTIQQASWLTPQDDYPIFLAIWGNDTLSYAMLPDTRFYHRYDD